MAVFHIAFPADWDAAKAVGEYRVSTRGASLDEVGFIHASNRDQVETIANLVYADVTGPLLLLVIDPEKLEVPVLVEEVPRTGMFPHVYGPLPVAAVVAVLDLERDPDSGAWVFPAAEDGRYDA